jgi:hypothetical protein
MVAAIAEGIYNYFDMRQNAPQAIPQAPNTNGLTAITGLPVATAEQMTAYIRRINPNAPDLAEIFIREGTAEGIRGDIAFAQSCIETGNFAFDRGTAVTLDQNNFCGMGVTSLGMKGNSYATPSDGIRAQVQHLKAYANTESLNNPLVVPTVGEARFRFVVRGYAPFVEWLGAQENPKNEGLPPEQRRGWAMGAGYGEKILRILNAIVATPVTTQTPSNPNELNHVLYQVNVPSGDTLNCRNGAGTSHSVLGVFRPGEIVTATRKSGNWLLVTNGKLTGWSSATYLGEMKLDSAIDRLVQDGVSNSGDYWRNNANAIENLPRLLTILGYIPKNSTVTAVVNNVNDALDRLGTKGFINSPDFWKPRHDKVEWLGQLIINVANRI